MAQEIGRQIIEDMYISLTTGKLIGNREYVSKLPQLTKAYHVIKNLRASTDVEKSLEAFELVKSDKDVFLELIKKEKAKDMFDWKVNLVLSNSQTFKCLTPKIELKIDGKDLEFDVETFEQLRYEVAKALNRLQKYHEIA
ncbi:unnamed protein product [Bursaphelenchus xylophilus]|uniref:(pine wood nematode) hypothetical protein n=1 Tax=Bursaphelenchus xylophilus TaxID=6326 RepID=A0A1I7S5H9_BURXY|nr:unnamed protein product [Bursaphelenchus xylophilus]CAG9124724.1 unnamed protein product [Bursaphelenchus xylophilus]